VGLALQPVTGEVWTTVNERDELGDDLPPDYFASLKDGGFYGWPYSYIGDNVDPPRQAAEAGPRCARDHSGRIAWIACGAAAVRVLYREAISGEFTAVVCS